MMESSLRFNLQAFVCVLDPNNPMEFLDIGCRNNYKTNLVKTFHFTRYCCFWEM